jgi:hypothetical protein
MWPEEELEDLVCDVICAVVHRYLGVCNLVRLLQFLCYKSVARERIVKTSGNRLRRLVWSDCKLCKSAVVESLFVVTTCRRLIIPITNPNTVFSH